MRQPGDVFETDVPARLDRLPFARFHWLVVAALGITWILDGVEVTLVGSLAPAIAAPGALNLSSSQIGALVVTQLNALSTAVIASLSTAQIGGLKTTQVKGLSTTVMAALRAVLADSLA